MIPAERRNGTSWLATRIDGGGRRRRVPVRAGQPGHGQDGAPGRDGGARQLDPYLRVVPDGLLRLRQPITSCLETFGVQLARPARGFLGGALARMRDDPGQAARGGQVALRGRPGPAPPGFPNRHIPPIPVICGLAWQAAEFDEWNPLPILWSRGFHSSNRGGLRTGLAGLAGLAGQGRARGYAGRGATRGAGLRGGAWGQPGARGARRVTGLGGACVGLDGAWAG